jgi:hypothetical protein
MEAHCEWKRKQQLSLSSFSKDSRDKDPSSQNGAFALIVNLLADGCWRCAKRHRLLLQARVMLTWCSKSVFYEAVTKELSDATQMCFASGSAQKKAVFSEVVLR